MTRDLISKDELTSRGLSPDRIVFSLDSAFWVESYLSNRIKQFMDLHGLEPGQFLIVTTRSWFSDRLRKYHGELAATINKLVPFHFQKVVLIPNMIDPENQLVDDKQATWELYRLIEKKELVTVFNDDLAPNELVGLYGQARLTLGTRLHSVIMALAAGTPVVAVSYSGHKTQGIMQAVGLRRYTMELDTFTRDSAVPLVLSALSTRGQIVHEIEELRRQGNMIFNALLQRFENSVGFLNISG
jgi:colanic acid/amylovoran biosynthesis protein